MRARLAVIAALVAFDVGVAVLVALNLIGPRLAVCLLITNPVAVLIERWLHLRRAQARVRDRN